MLCLFLFNSDLGLAIVKQPFRRQFNKMVKHTQTIRQQIANELFERVWPFCEIDA